MSPRAAWRLESLGFEQVYEYRPGKADWTSAGLPVEGKLAAVPRLGQLARQDVPRVSLTDQVGQVAKRASSEGWDTALVVNDEGILLGRLFKGQLEGDPEAAVDDVMEPGPSTFRPDVDVIHMAKTMSDNDLDTAPVTTSEGIAVGIVLRDDLEKVMRDIHVDPESAS